MFPARIGASRMAATRPLGLAVTLLLAACSPSADGTTEPSPSESAAVASPSEAASEAPFETPAADADEIATAILTIHDGPDLPTAAFDSMWILAPDGDDNAVVRVDPETNETIARISIGPSPCQALGASDDAIWVCTPDGASRIDPATNAITGTVAYDVGTLRGQRMAFGAGAVWTLGSDGFEMTNLVRIDPASEEATTFPLGRAAAGVAFGFDAVWITAPDEGLLLRFEPATGEVTEHASGLVDPWIVIAGPDSLWVTLHGTAEARPEADDPTVARVDPDDGTVIAEIATGAGSGTSGSLWAEADAVWVRAPDLFLVRIDPNTNEVVETIVGPPTSGDVTVAFGSVWATAVERQTVYRLAP
ncbi:MAG TPA: hypothetical protein VI277_05620 [Candidatus Limnocylindria bacterium]